MNRTRLLEKLAIVATALAAIATSQPPADWEQRDEVTDYRISVGPKERKTLTLDFAFPPATSWDRHFNILAKSGPQGDVSVSVVNPDDGLPCASIQAREQAAGPSVPEDDEWVSILDGCFLDRKTQALRQPTSGSLLLVIEASEFQASTAEVSISVQATAAGNDHDEQEPHVSVELY